MQTIIVRPLAAEDSLVELTTLLHRAFARLKRMGLACRSADQPVAVTRQRIGQGECFVAVCGGRIVGTLTLYRHERTSESEVYRSRRVASLHQFAVEPEFQGRGIGRRLLEYAESWSARHGYRELALDTPAPAEHLIAFYQHHGFYRAETLAFTGRPYRSAVHVKAVSPRAAGFSSFADTPLSAARHFLGRPSFALSRPACGAIRGLAPRLRQHLVSAR